MDFPEKLKPKIQSRMGNDRLVYKPYTSQQIETIIINRIQFYKELFEPEAIAFLSKKVA